MSVDHDAAADMDRNFSTAQMRLLRDDGMSLDCSLEVFAENRTQAGFDMVPQCRADFGLLAGYSKLHGSNHPYRGWAARRQTWARRHARSSSV